MAVPMAAGAHSGETGGTDYQTTMTTVPAGIDVRVIGGDDRLEVRRTTAREVVILGYGKEPYLRLDAQGTWENRNSPAVALNDERYTSDPVPETATKLGPDWVQTSTGDSVIFHDHRSHWMGSQPPVDVRGEPGTTRTLYDWAVPMVIDESPVEAPWSGSARRPAGSGGYSALCSSSVPCWSVSSLAFPSRRWRSPAPSPPSSPAW